MKISVILLCLVSFVVEARAAPKQIVLPSGAPGFVVKCGNCLAVAFPCSVE